MRSARRRAPFVATAALALTALLTACVPATADPSPRPTADAGVRWEETTYDPARPPVEWVDAEAGVFRMSVRGYAYCTEVLEAVELGPSGADVVTSTVEQDCPLAGKLKAFVTVLPAGFDRAVPVLVSLDGRVVGELLPASEGPQPLGGPPAGAWPWRPVGAEDSQPGVRWADQSALTVLWTTIGGGCSPTLRDVVLIDATTVDCETRSQTTGACSSEVRIANYITSLPVGVSIYDDVTVMLDGAVLGTLPTPFR
ncbi:hypothetical protein [Herbiconiux sp.]|uniref:hypothetical protein n=1 Tax=Herbiconiux sp. TaxID=1871186 RepID=UPI0025BCB1F6|nr:hypothetical protein [Herbiconiux sp.]